MTCVAQWSTRRNEIFAVFTRECAMLYMNKRGYSRHAVSVRPSVLLSVRLSRSLIMSQRTSCVDHKDRNDMWPTAASQFPQQFPSYSNRKCKKIAVFTYRSPHFCFPWRRPCDYHASCCMDGKAIQCLPNSSQHVAIYLQ